MSRAHRRLIVFALATLLAAPAAWGRAPQRRAASPSLSPASLMLSFLAGWGGLGLPGEWHKNGCIVDPYGRCLKDQGANNACLVGPDGDCAPNATTDNGCLVDPYGRCLQGH